jgi:hypothetical protein
MYSITLGGITVTADNEAELRLAIAVLNTPLGSLHMPVAVNAPAPSWRVGGPPDPKPLPPIPNERIAVPKPVLRAVPTESPDSVAPQHVSVTRLHLDVLEAVMLFPEGVTTRGVSQLLGLSNKTAGGRIQGLKRQGLIEKLPGHKSWRATTLARRAKIVAS